MFRSSRLLILPFVLSAYTCTTEPVSTAQAPCEEHPLHAELIASDDARLRVILTLVQDGDEDPAALQSRVLQELDGTQHEVVRRSDNFPILTLVVGEDALCRLVRSALVASIERDQAEPPTD